MAAAIAKNVKRHVPLRTCVGCGRTDDKRVLIRIARAAGRLQLDAVGVGRGAYVHAEGACIEGLAKSRLLGRSLRGGIDGAERVSIAQEVARRCGLPSQESRG